MNILKWSSLCVATALSMNAMAQQQSAADKYYEISKGLEIYNNVIRELNTSYVNELTPKTMFKTSIDAMLKQLDPYTVYISQADIAGYEMLEKGQYAGIGVSLRQDAQKRVVIANIIENSPAALANVKVGDIILKVNDIDATAYDVETVGALLRNTSAHQVRLSLQQPITKEINQYTINKGDVAVKSVTNARLVGAKKDIAYVYLAQFSQNCAAQVFQQIDSLKKANNDQLAGVIIDLRDNGGGLLDQAVALSNLFLPKGKVVVTTQGNVADYNKVYATEKAAWNEQIPVGILINNNSASASEIVSGTLQDYDRAIIMGSSSFGKGLVQIIKDVGYQSKLKLTISKYFLPSGRLIQKLDYEHKNEDGTAQSLVGKSTKTFKTSNGRTVVEGNGIEPDIKSVTDLSSPSLTALLQQGILADFATYYATQHTKIAAANSFKVTDALYTEFINWYKKNAHIYKNNAIKQLQELTATLRNEALQVDTKTLTALEQQLFQNIENQLLSNKKQIAPLLSKEIVSRYYYNNGGIENMLTVYDEDIQKLCEILKDPKEYQRILKP